LDILLQKNAAISSLNRNSCRNWIPLSRYRNCWWGISMLMCCTVCGLLIQSYMHAVYINDGDKAWIKFYFETLLDFATRIPQLLWCIHNYFLRNYSFAADLEANLVQLLQLGFSHSSCPTFTHYGCLAVSGNWFRTMSFNIPSSQFLNTSSKTRTSLATLQLQIPRSKFKWEVSKCISWPPSQVVHLDVDSFVSTLAPGSGFADLRKRVRPGTAGCCGASPGFAQIKCQLDYPQVDNANWYHKPK
jgi:hypothetical protein